TAANGSAVFITSGNKLGTATSSKRFKEAIRPMDQSSEALYALKPVTFRYKKEIDPEAKSQFGLVAEDVEKVNPDLIVHNKEGNTSSLRYDEGNAMWHNKFHKEHKTVQQKGKTTAQLKKQIKRVTATLQKTSPQLELNKPMPGVVENKPKPKT